MLISITSNTFNQFDNGEITDCTPLDFVLNINHSILSFYSMNSTLVKQINSDYLWRIIECGKDFSCGIDTAFCRPYTVIQASGTRYHEYKKQQINFNIYLNHYGGGLGGSNVVNNIVNYIMHQMPNLNKVDINFLRHIGGA